VNYPTPNDPTFLGARTIASNLLRDPETFSELLHEVRESEGLGREFDSQLARLLREFPAAIGDGKTNGALEQVFQAIARIERLMFNAAFNEAVSEMDLTTTAAHSSEALLVQEEDRDDRKGSRRHGKAAVTHSTT
jgi:hypothetical protein